MPNWTFPVVPNTPDEVPPAPNLHRFARDALGQPTAPPASTEAEHAIDRRRDVVAECTAAVSPRDAPPIRSPLRVHHYLAGLFRGKVVAEIGTRNGDGIECFSRFARRTIAIEMQKDYCEALTQRALALRAAHSRGYDVLCERFGDASAAATAVALRGVDYIHWWVGGNLNAEVLRSAYDLYKQGHLHGQTQAVILFDMRWGTDIESWRRIEKYANWKQPISFDECDTCRRLYPADIWDRYVTCARAIGTFIVAGLTISELEVALPELLTPSEFGRNGLQPPDNYRSSSCVAAPTGVR